MRLHKGFLLILMTFMILSFTVNRDVHKIKIIESSQPLRTMSFELKDGQIQLKSDSEFNFYATITSKTIKGKYFDVNYNKIKRKGTQYKVTYIYENFRLDRETKIKRNIIVWEDGDIVELRATPEIWVDNIALKTEAIKE